MTRKVSPLIIEVRGNEFAGHDNPHVPWGSQAIIDDAVACAEAGATGYHWHARGTDGVDRPDDRTLHRHVIEQLRARTGLFLHQTLGFTSTQGDAASRVATVAALRQEGYPPDIVPVDFGAVITDRFDHGVFTTHDDVLLNHSGYLHELLQALQTMGMPVMAVVWSPGAVRTALRMRDLGVLPPPTFWQLGFTGDRIPGGLPPTERQLNAFLDILPAGEPWTVHVRDGDGLAMAALAILHGGHVSIGLGDDPYTRLGHPTNADLVRRVADLAETIGRPPASADQARAIAGL